jgi:hypothetical protein
LNLHPVDCTVPRDKRCFVRIEFLDKRSSCSEARSGHPGEQLKGASLMPVEAP